LRLREFEGLVHRPPPGRQVVETFGPRLAQYTERARALVRDVEAFEQERLGAAGGPADRKSSTVGWRLSSGVLNWRWSAWPFYEVSDCGKALQMSS